MHAVGTVNGRGYNDQQTTLFVMVMGRTERVETNLSEVLADFNLLYMLVQ